MMIRNVLFFIFLLLNTAAVSRPSASDLELNEAVQKKDWPEVVLRLQPLQGQNFEHDLILARALLSLERRAEAQKLLADLYSTHKDEKTTQLFHLSGTIFFSQETSSLYYDGVQLLSALKFQEAKEHFDQAIAREPGHVLVLSRLVQVEIQLGLLPLAKGHLKVAQALTPSFPQLKVMAAKLMLSAPPDEEEGAEDVYRSLLPLKSTLLENDATVVLWADVLKRMKKKNDLESLSISILNAHPMWTYALVWFYVNADLTPKTKSKLKVQIDRGLKDKAEFNARLDTEMKSAQYYWVGNINYDALLKQLN